jgi:peptide/nickel transport system substrate-binding protein
MPRRLVLLAAVVAVLLAVRFAVLVPGTEAQAQATTGTVVIAIRQDPSAPVPYIGPTTTGNGDVTDQLFLRLAGLGPRSSTIGDDALVPELASRWVRQDSLTVDFILNPAARWHDGTPVTARDVTFAWDLLRRPVLAVTQAPFALIESVTAIGTGTVRVRFRRRSSEQVYVAGFQLQPLPAHLMANIPTDSLTTSAFARSPVGNGPYRFVRREPGQSVELRAVDNFFLGRPGIARLVFRVVGAIDAQVNLLLAGEVDVLSEVPAIAVDRVNSARAYRTVTAPGNLITNLVFNSRVASDTSKPHPILADQRVRHALALALDRKRIALTAFGPAAETPLAVRSQAWYWLGGGRDGGGANLGRARALLREAGWRDSDGNGILDRNGEELQLKVLYPVQATVFAGIAVQLEQMWRAVGVRAVLDPVDGSLWMGRRRAGGFDVDISGANQDPSPSSLAQSWSCASAAQPLSSNVGRWCDPEFDRLLQAAPAAADPVAGFRAAFARMATWQPVVVAAAPANRVAVHRRYDNVIVRPSRAWTALWQWRIRPGAALPRDR